MRDQQRTVERRMHVLMHGLGHRLRMPKMLVFLGCLRFLAIGMRTLVRTGPPMDVLAEGAVSVRRLWREKRQLPRPSNSGK